MKNDNLSPKINLLLFSSKYDLIDLNNETKNPFGSLLSECSETEKTEIISIKNPNIIYFYFLYKELIDKILYDKDELIKIDSKNFETNLSSYFYLTLLIEDKDNKGVINYEYNFQIIENLINKLEKTGEFYSPILANMMFKLINNYDQISDLEQEIEEKKDSLNEIKENVNENLDSEKVQTKLNKFHLDYTSQNINDFCLEDIYINIIINVLLKTYLTDTKYEKEIEEFIEEIDLKNIDLTKSMLNKIVEFFNGEEKNKYIISEAKDFKDEKKLNFFYYLCKYILKKNYYIYQINFLKELKGTIKNIIKTQKQLLQELINSDKKKEKLIYIIEFFTDDDKIIKSQNAQIIFESNVLMDGSQGRRVSGQYSSSSYFNERKHYQNINSFRIPSSTKTKTDFLNRNKYDNPDNLSFLDDENNYELLHFKKYIMNHKNVESKQVLELGNHSFLKTDFYNHIYLYDKDYNFQKVFSNDDYIQKINNLENVDSFIIIQPDLLKYTKSDNKDLTEFKKEKNIHRTNQCFEINKETEYLVSGNEGLYHKTLKNNEEEIKEISKENLLDGIKITDSLYAFYSNEKFTDGKSVILIYDTKIPINDQKKNNNPMSINIFKNSEGKITFPSYNNPFHYIDVNKNYKILLCACRGYKPENANGILIIRIDPSSLKIKIQTLFDTEDFEVSCFCTIPEGINEKNAYILVGGLEADKRRGMIKLYKLTYNDFNDDVKISFIQDAIEDYDRFQDDNDFDGRITKIFIPEGKEKDVIVQCFGGSCYLFTLPKADNYMEKYELMAF